MKRILAILFFHGLGSQFVAAQDTMPAAYEILSESLSIAMLPDTSWQVLEDERGNWTIKDVSQPPFTEKFHTNAGYSYNINTYWIRCRIRNKMDHETEIYFRSNAPFHEVYARKSNSDWCYQKAGWLIPWSEKDGMRGLEAISVVIPAGEELIIYRRLEYNFKISRPAILRIGFQFTKNALRNNYINNEGEILEKFLFAINSSLFLLTAILSFFFYQITRERVFIRGAIGYFFFSLLFFAPTIFILFKEHPVVVHYAWRLIDSSTIFVTVYVLRAFLQIKERFPVWDKVLVTVSLIPLLDLALRFMSPAIALSNYQPIIFFLLLATCLYLIKHKDRAARIFVIGVLPLFTFVLFDNVEVLNTPAYLSYWTGVGFLAYLWLVISINRILFYRYKQMQTKLVKEELEKELLAKQIEVEKRMLIEQQKVELEKQVSERTEELRQSLNHLKSTQSQLIQSEKMASLGELTAGIAHEIQNPLIFVNNFSEVNKELIGEMKTEIEKGNFGEAKLLANDIEENQEKINHHGKRAGDIVKGMLQHSRSSSGVKEPTDINALADEYLRLAYHGLRAKDKSFSAKFATDFDSTLPKINIIPQDIGRVILNLITNAFYTVTEKSSFAKAAEDKGYEPTVIVSTKKEGDKVLISVNDNGNGIPQKVLNKIFQPFFTTKPAGQGTGLGLSLSYDIVKAHSGEIKVETREGEGTTFIIQIPV